MLTIIYFEVKILLSLIYNLYLILYSSNTSYSIFYCCIPKMQCFASSSKECKMSFHEYLFSFPYGYLWNYTVIRLNIKFHTLINCTQEHYCFFLKIYDMKLHQFNNLIKIYFHKKSRYFGYWVKLFELK